MDGETLSRTLCQVLEQLLVPDNNVIQEATVRLKTLMKEAAVVPSLCLVLKSAPQPQTRQYAAVLLRRRIAKKQQWNTLSAEMHTSMKENLLDVMLQETEKPVRAALAQLVATVARHELTHNNWPHLLQFFQQYCLSENSEQKLVGMYVLSVVAQTASEQLQPHFSAVLTLCSQALTTEQHLKTQYYAVITLQYMAAQIGSEEVKPVQAILPNVITVIQRLIEAGEEEEACEALEIFDELLETDLPILVPFVKDIIEFSLMIGANKNLEDSLRIKGLSFICDLAKPKRKAITKLKLVPVILSSLYPVLCEESTVDDSEEFGEAEGSTAASYGAMVVDSLALNLPPKEIIPHLMQLIQKGIESGDPQQEKAAYWCMAVSAEGCADHIRTKHLKTLLQCIYKGVESENVVVKNAAFFALGQFSEYLQPDISKYSAELLPLLFKHVESAAQNIQKDPKSVAKIYYALEMFCENLGKDLLPYLPGLMEHILTVIASSAVPRIKELSISSIAAVANAAEEELVPYFPKIIELLKVYLNPTEDEELAKLQIQAIDTLAVLAGTMGAVHFEPLANDCIVLGLKLMETSKDPDLKRCIYSLFAAVSAIVKEGMQPYLDPIVPALMNAVVSTEGITAEYGDQVTQLLQLFDEESDSAADESIGSQDDDDEHLEVKDITVENAYLDEKEAACFAVGEICLNTGACFLKYTDLCYDEIHKLYGHPLPSIRRAALTAITQFCRATHKLVETSPTDQAREILNAMLLTTTLELLDVIKHDEDRQVVMVGFDALSEMLKQCKQDMLIKPDDSIETSTFTEIMQAVISAFNHKLDCQSFFTEEDEVSDTSQESEYDTMVVENAGDVIPALASVVPNETFIPIFANFLPEFMKRMKKNSSVAEKSFAVGAIAETLESCGPSSVVFTPTLFPVFTQLLGDEDDEVRNNAAFAMGIMAANGGDFITSKYAEMLKLLFNAIQKETEDLPRDNICSAVSRMAASRPDLVPLDQVLPVMLQHLPYKADYEEHVTAFNSIAHLYRLNSEVIVKYTPQLFRVFAAVLGTKQVKEESVAVIVNLVKDLHVNHVDAYTQAYNALDPEAAGKISSCLQM